MPVNLRFIPHHCTRGGGHDCDNDTQGTEKLFRHLLREIKPLCVLFLIRSQHSAEESERDERDKI